VKAVRAVDAQRVADGWRRTVNGWEQRSEWSWVEPDRLSPLGRIAAAVHPLNIAVLQALLSIGALLLMSSDPVASRSTSPPAPDASSGA
jgi:hypothetical protein